MIASALATIGMLGFLACCAINMSAQGRLLGHPEFRTPSPERPIAIELKGLRLFVEPDYGHRVLMADRFVRWFALVAALGIVLGNRKLLSVKPRQQSGSF